MFFGCNNLEVYPKRYHGNTFFSRLRLAGFDVGGYVIRSLWKKIECYAWKEGTLILKQIIKNNWCDNHSWQQTNIYKVKTNVILVCLVGRDFTRFMSEAVWELLLVRFTPSNGVAFAHSFYFAKNCDGNLASDTSVRGRAKTRELSVSNQHPHFRGGGTTRHIFSTLITPIKWSFQKLNRHKTRSLKCPPLHYSQPSRPVTLLIMWFMLYICHSVVAA